MYIALSLFNRTILFPMLHDNAEQKYSNTQLCFEKNVSVCHRVSMKNIVTMKRVIAKGCPHVIINM